MAYARISITLPRDLVKAADQRARSLDRSRSWLVAEALRAYLRLAQPGVPWPVRLSEAPAGAYAAQGLGESRLAQLKADLALTPEQRVLAAARAAQLAEHVRPRFTAPGPRLLQFESYEDYLNWKRVEDLA